MRANNDKNNFFIYLTPTYHCPVVLCLQIHEIKTALVFKSVLNIFLSFNNKKALVSDLAQVAQLLTEHFCRDKINIVF